MICNNDKLQKIPSNFKLNIHKIWPLCDTMVYFSYILIVVSKTNLQFAEPQISIFTIERPITKKENLHEVGNNQEKVGRLKLVRKSQQLIHN